MIGLKSSDVSRIVRNILVDLKEKEDLSLEDGICVTGTATGVLLKQVKDKEMRHNIALGLIGGIMGTLESCLGNDSEEDEKDEEGKEKEAE